MDMFVDATGQIAGRLSTRVVKEAMKGKNVYVLNAEKAVISGNPDFIFKDYKEKRERGDPYHGPFYPRAPERLLKRIIRGMIDYKRPQGKAVFKRIKVYISVPEEFKDKQAAGFKEAENRLAGKSMTIGELSLRLGARKVW